jgi:hypothetical protein
MKTANVPFKLKPVHNRRLREVIAFLDELPTEKFNFAEIRCKSVGCAIGWCPTIFPKHVTLRSFRSFKMQYAGLRGVRRSGFEEVAMWVTGLAYEKAPLLFQPGDQKSVNRRLATCGPGATPSEVARMLEKFIQIHS